MKKRMRFLLPALLALASVIWTACDSRSISGSSQDPNGREIAQVEVSVQQTEVYYSQSSRTAIRDTVTVLVLDAERTALSGVTVSCQVQSSFGGALIPLDNHTTDENGEAHYAFRVLASDQAFEGEQEVTFLASAGNRSGTASLLLIEQSDIQLAFLNPADASTIYRMEDPAETLPVQVYAYRDVEVGGETQRVGVPGVALNFSVASVGPGIAGVVSAQGVTGADGVTNNVYYSNSSAQPADSVQIRFTAAVSGSSDFFTTSNVKLMNDFGYRLQRILPQNPELQGDQLCADSTRFVYQYRDRNSNPVSGARFNIEPSFGELTDNGMYSLVTDESGIIAFSWRSCALEGGDLMLSMVHSSGRAFNYLFPVADARPIDLYIINPVPGGELEIDSECLDANVTNVSASLRYNDTHTAIVGRTVTFSASFGQLGASAITDANGVAAVTWHDCNEAHAGQTLTLSAALLNSQNVAVLQVDEPYPVDLPLGTPHHISLSVANQILPDPQNGSLQTTATATVYNSQNQRLGSNLPVGFRTNGIGQVTAGAFTNEQGQAAAVFSMNNQTGISQVRAYFVQTGGDQPDTLWSNPTTVTVQSGMPVSITMGTATPRIQILGFGSASEALVSARVLDASGALVTMNTAVKFFIQSGPLGCFLSTPGMEDHHELGDTLTTTSQSGLAQMVINSGERPGVVQVGAVINDNGLDVYSSRSLVTIVAGPPFYGQLDFEPIGEQVGGSIWRITWGAHFWDRFNNEVEDSTNVYFYSDPPQYAPFDGWGMTGFDAMDEPDLRGVAKDFMQYHCQVEGTLIDSAWACSAGEIALYENPFDPLEVTGYIPGNVCVFKAGFQLPFQPGDRDDNLTLQVSTDRIIYSSNPCGGYPACQDVTVVATLKDGYTCLVANQLIQFFCSSGGTFDPAEGYTDVNGQVQTTLTVCPQVLDNNGMPCPEPNDACFRWNAYSLSVWAQRQPGGPNSDVSIIQLERPCD